MAFLNPSPPVENHFPTGGEPLPPRRRRIAEMSGPCNVARPLDDGVLEVRHRPSQARAMGCFFAQRPSAHHQGPSDSLTARSRPRAQGAINGGATYSERLCDL